MGEPIKDRPDQVRDAARLLFAAVLAFVGILVTPRMLYVFGGDWSVFVLSRGEWLLIGAIGIVPSLLAWWRGHPYLWPIVAINVLLGWNLIGYVAALAWALVPLHRGSNR
ncbi:MAG TPA: superinfection immunity protein [Pirellulales bacterium]|nr:superinfection immunity protein [Pirellulales bacterium]